MDSKTQRLAIYTLEIITCTLTEGLEGCCSNDLTDSELIAALQRIQEFFD